MRDLPRAAGVAEVKQIAEKNEQDLAVTFLAKDLRGRASYAVASALLYFASAAAIGFGLGVVGRRNGARIAFGALLCSVFFGYIVASTPPASDLLMRPLVGEHILAAANKLGPPMNVLASGDADHSLFNQIRCDLIPSRRPVWRSGGDRTRAPDLHDHFERGRHACRSHSQCFGPAEKAADS
jgi:hypothetical protein